MSHQERQYRETTTEEFSLPSEWTPNGLDFILGLSQGTTRQSYESERLPHVLKNGTYAEEVWRNIAQIDGYPRQLTDDEVLLLCLFHKRWSDVHLSITEPSADRIVTVKRVLRKSKDSPIPEQKTRDFDLQLSPAMVEKLEQLSQQKGLLMDHILDEDEMNCIRSPQESRAKLFEIAARGDTTMQELMQMDAEGFFWWEPEMTAFLAVVRGEELGLLRIDPKTDVVSIRPLPGKS